MKRPVSRRLYSVIKFKRNQGTKSNNRPIVLNVPNGFELKCKERDEQEKMAYVEIRLFQSGQFVGGISFKDKISFSTIEKLRNQLNDIMRRNYNIEFQCEGMSYLDIKFLLELMVESSNR